MLVFSSLSQRLSPVLCVTLPIIMYEYVPTLLSFPSFSLPKHILRILFDPVPFRDWDVDINNPDSRMI